MLGLVLGLFSRAVYPKCLLEVLAQHAVHTNIFHNVFYMFCYAACVGGSLRYWRHVQQWQLGAAELGNYLQTLDT